MRVGTATTRASAETARARNGPLPMQRLLSISLQVLPMAAVLLCILFFPIGSALALLFAAKLLCRFCGPDPAPLLQTRNLIAKTG